MIKRLLMLIVCTLAMLTAGAQKYISDVKIGGGSKKANTSKNNATSGGYTLIDYDLNSGASGCFIYLAYKRTDDPAKAITGLIIMAGKQYGSDYYLSNPITIGYKRYYLAPYADGDADYGDLNDGAGGEHLYLYYSKDEGGAGQHRSHKITNLTISNSSSVPSGFDDVVFKHYDPKSSGTVCDLNSGAGGKYIYLHYAEECVHTYKEYGYCPDCMQTDLPEDVDGWFEINRETDIYRINKYRKEVSNDVKVRLNCDLDYDEVAINDEGRLTLTWGYGASHRYPIFYDTFRGVFDGQGHTIKRNSGGVFTNLNNAEVKNLRISNCYRALFTDDDYSDNKDNNFLCIYANNSKITNCVIDNCVMKQQESTSEKHSAALFCYRLENGSEMSNCYAAHNEIDDDGKYGNLVYEVDGSAIRNCFCLGNKTNMRGSNVFAYSIVGASTIENCYSDAQGEMSPKELNEYITGFYNGSIAKQLNKDSSGWHQTAMRDPHPLLPWQYEAVCCKTGPYGSFVNVSTDTHTYADVNDDKHVDVSDLACLIDSMKTGNVTKSIATDVNFDNSVNIKDVDKMAKLVTGKDELMSYVPRTGNITIDIDDTYKLPVCITPSSLAASLEWSSSDMSIAKVDNNGVVTPADDGTVTIKAKLPGTNVDVCSYEITVKPIYVDLGLPSATLWAPCNVGATNPDEYGLEFLWGETVGYEKGSFDYHNSTYKFYDKTIGHLTKYCGCGGKNCPNDRKTKLDFEDDAAYVNLGPDWRMPTYDEWNELINWSYIHEKPVKINGVTHTKYISLINGKSLIRPDAFYFTCEIDTTKIGWIYSFHHRGSCTRLSNAMPVRAVRRQKNITSVKFANSRLIGMPGEQMQLKIEYTPSTATNVELEWEISDPSIVEVDKNTYELKIKKEGVAIIKISALGLNETFTDSVIVTVFDNKQTVSPQYVDLGLPSGTMWATCNIGARAQEDPGLYFAWGETEGYSMIDLINQKTNKYKWFKGDNLRKGYTKYTVFKTMECDNKSMLELEDDAAYVNWGENWRMPTREEQEELVQNCSWTEKTVNNIKGLLGVSKLNGKSLFFPYTGYSYNVFWGTDEGYYWSSSLYVDLLEEAVFIGSNTHKAYFIRTSKNKAETTFFFREIYYPIRPVRRK